jgi:hypothetical protein
MEAQLEEVEQKSEKKKTEVPVFIVCELQPSLISSSWSSYRLSYNRARSRMGLVVLHHLHNCDFKMECVSSIRTNEQEANVACTVYLIPFRGSMVRR